MFSWVSRHFYLLLIGEKSRYQVKKKNSMQIWLCKVKGYKGKKSVGLHNSKVAVKGYPSTCW